MGLANNGDKMSRKINRGMVLWCAVTVAMLCVPLWAQENGGNENGPIIGELYTSNLPIGVPASEKILPVRVLREFELGTALERFASTTSRLLERREKVMADAAWKIDERTTITPTAIMVRDAVQVAYRRLGTRLDYSWPGERAGGDLRDSRILDFDEVKSLENALSMMLGALDRGSGKSETASWEYRSRSGLTISLSLAQKDEDVAVTASVWRVKAEGKAQARQILEAFGAMMHKVNNQLASY